MVKRHGFTLIELMVALAVFAVVLVITTGAIGGFFRMGSAQDQQNTLQQNFRFAVDAISMDARQAVQVGVPGSSNDVLTMTDSVSLEINDQGVLRWIRYRVNQSGSGSSTTAELVREYVTYDAGTGTWSPDTSVAVSARPVTERIPELLKVYFIDSGNRLFVVMVGRMTYFGRQQTVSLVSLVYARNRGGSGT